MSQLHHCNIEGFTFSDVHLCLIHVVDQHLFSTDTDIFPFTTGSCEWLELYLCPYSRFGNIFVFCLVYHIVEKNCLFVFHSIEISWTGHKLPARRKC